MTRERPRRRASAGPSAAVRQFDDAFLDKDLERLIAFYHEDAIAISYSGNISAAKAEIEQGFRSLFQLDFIANGVH